MAITFLRFKPGGASDPKLRTDENASNEHVGFVKLDVGGAGLNDPVSGSVPTRNIGTPNSAHGQVSVGTAATQIIASRPTRRALLIINGGTVDVFLGNSNAVTVSTGVLLVGVKGTGFPWDATGAVFGRVSTGSQVVSYVEFYD